MRSSKNRSRGKSNRNRNPGNNLNRVFDSSGPEGKVRGTPQQIIDKYTQLARDAVLSNDRVAAENFQQHAEHYTRLLGEAQRDAEARRAQAEQHNRDRQQREREEREARIARQEAAAAGAGQQQQQQHDSPRRAAPPPDDPANLPQPLGEPIKDSNAGDDESGLVETPESKPKKRPGRSRKPRRPAAPDSNSEAGKPESPEAAE